jgi:hypothetical protein
MSESTKKTKVLFFGTHPKQFNGYSKVVYELSKELSKSQDIELVIYGFQNFYQQIKHRIELPSNVTVYDAFANESPKTTGFGPKEVTEYVTSYAPRCKHLSRCTVVRGIYSLHLLLQQWKQDGICQTMPQQVEVGLQSTCAHPKSACILSIGARSITRLPACSPLVQGQSQDCLHALHRCKVNHKTACMLSIGARSITRLPACSITRVACSP